MFLKIKKKSFQLTLSICYINILIGNVLVTFGLKEDGFFCSTSNRMKCLYHRLQRTSSNCRDLNTIHFNPNVAFRIILITMFVITWTTQSVPHVKQDLLSNLDHLRSLLVFGWVRVSWCFRLLYYIFCTDIFPLNCKYRINSPLNM